MQEDTEASEGGELPQPSERIFASEVVDRLRSTENAWALPGGELLLPRVFGFCRGVKRALAMLEKACDAHAQSGRFFLLGQIIHNPWVNDYFQKRGVRILSADEMAELERHITDRDCAVIPAFGVPLPIERRLRAIGCAIVDTSCGDVRRLWVWAEKASHQGYGILIFGRANHDETVVTKSRLAEAGGKYLVVGNLRQVEQFCNLLIGPASAQQFRAIFGSEATNADSLAPFARLAQVSQTTMLYEDTMKVRRLVAAAFETRYPGEELSGRLLFEPTVCRATQDRQAAAVELCQARLDLVVVVGGYGSSNTRHLYDLARQFAPAYFIEDATSIHPSGLLQTVDPASGQAMSTKDWLPLRRPLRIGVLAGASTPEEVVGQVLQRLSTFLGR